MKELFTFEPKLEGYEKNGSEPSLRTLIFNYYREHFAFGDALEFMNQYENEILKQLKGKV